MKSLFTTHLGMNAVETKKKMRSVVSNRVASVKPETKTLIAFLEDRAVIHPIFYLSGWKEKNKLMRQSA